MTDERTVDLAGAPVVLPRRATCAGCGANLRKHTTVYRVAGGYAHARCRAKALERGRFVDVETGEIYE